MTDAAGRAALEQEAGTFARALTGEVPTDYVVTQYVRAHQHLALTPTAPFDHTLLAFAALGSWATRAADGYARCFAPTAALRRKLSVLLAILESTAPSDAAFASRETSPSAVLVELALTGAGFACLLVVGVVALAPLHLADRLSGGA